MIARINEQLREAINRAAAVLKQTGAREVYLFGSSAAGTLHEQSDIDPAVTGLPPERFFQAMAQAARVLERQLDLLDLDEANLFTAYVRGKGPLLRVG